MEGSLLTTERKAKMEAMSYIIKTNTKDPNAPKRSLSSFFLYCKDERDKVKSSNSILSPIELGRRWKEINPQIKKKYEDKAKAEKQLYDKAKAAYSKRPKLESDGAVAPAPDEPPVVVVEAEEVEAN